MKEEIMATTIPVTIEADAAGRVAELGMQAEFDQMIEHAKQAVPGLEFIRVTLEYDPECPENEPRVVIWAKRDREAIEPSAAAVNMDLSRWRAETLSPDVCWQIVMIVVYGDFHGW